MHSPSYTLVEKTYLHSILVILIQLTRGTMYSLLKYGSQNQEVIRDIRRLHYYISISFLFYISSGSTV